MTAPVGLLGNVNITLYTSTPVSVGSYTVLVPITPKSSSNLEITDTSGELILLAVGATGKEVPFCTIGPSSAPVVVSIPFIPKGSQISAQAINTNASTGYNLMSFL